MIRKFLSRRRFFFLCLTALTMNVSLLTRPAASQSATRLPDVSADASAAGEKFIFISDGPLGSGWDRTNEIARVFFHESLPAFFSRTITLDQDIVRNNTLSWIFTGQHAGFTVEIDSTTVRLFQRYYDSYGLQTSQKPKSGFPEKIVQDDVVPYAGHPREITIISDSHFSLQLWLNGTRMIQQNCLFDVSRHQLQLTAPRTEHDVVSGLLLQTKSNEATISVDPAKKHQTMLGFGGSPSIPAYASLSEQGKKQYWSLMKRYNLLIDREYPMGTRLKPDMSNLDHLEDASPHYYGDNFPNGEVSDFAYSKKALDLGGKVIYEMWDLPPWAAQPPSDPEKKSTHAVANPEAYAHAMVTYCRIAKERTGQAPAIVGVQNEVEQPRNVALEMVRVLRKRLDEAGFSQVKIHMADASFTWQGIERAQQLREHPDVWKSIDFAATHEYDYQDYFTDPDVYDQRLQAMHDASKEKPFLATEITLNKPSLQEPSYRAAFTVGQLYHKNLTILDSIGLLYCWLILDVEQPNFGASRSLLIPDRYRGDIPVASSFQLRVLGAYSRHILEGMQRVETISSNPDLLTTAFTDNKGNATLVVLNRSVTPQRLTVQWDGIQWKELERTSLYLENATSNIPAELLLQPGEILTLSTLSASSLE